MGELIVIMEKTPFPGHWSPCAMYRIQEAEFCLFRDEWYEYHKRIVKLCNRSVNAYTRQDATRILEYLQNAHPNAQYQLWAHITTSDENGDNDHD